MDRNRSDILLWVKENGGCSDIHCAKCFFLIQERFEEITAEMRASIVDSLYTLEIAQLTDAEDRYRDAVSIVPYLTTQEYQRFLDSLRSRAPFSAADAWGIVRASGSCYRHTASFLVQRPLDMSLNPAHFMLHPQLAPDVIFGLLGSTPMDADILKVIGLFRPVAARYPQLLALLPKWERERHDAEMKRMIAEKHAAEEWAARKKLEAAEDERRLRETEAMDLPAALEVIVEHWPRTQKLLRPVWLLVDQKQLSSLPVDLADRLARAVERDPSREWARFVRRIRHAKRVLFHAERSEERARLIESANEVSITERLARIVESGRPLTYFPDEWAQLAFAEIGSMGTSLALRLINRSARLGRAGSWRSLRNRLAKLYCPS